MTVRELIKQLKQYPPDSNIGMYHHDHNEADPPTIVRTVEDYRPELCEDPAAAENIFVVLKS